MTEEKSVDFNDCYDATYPIDALIRSEKVGETAVMTFGSRLFLSVTDEKLREMVDCDETFWYLTRVSGRTGMIGTVALTDREAWVCPTCGKD